MSQPFDQEPAVQFANRMYHEGGASLRAIARTLKVSRHAVENLIVFNPDKWEERRQLAGGRPLHFDEVLAVA